MLQEHNKRDKRHLVNLISKRSNNTPSFALLIGAGASASSGIKTTSEMIAEWRRQLYGQSKNSKPFEEWLKEQDWYGDDEEYPILFEKAYDQRSQRRIYIEECVKDAKPSWGYIYLANIIANKYFNVIFTPNFEDLLNEACFIYANLRPIVCAHDSAVADIRLTSARPKIIKLHGDFFYDSIKNTVRETESLEKNMRDKFMQFSGEYGMAVIGYSGNDRSIMDILDTMLRSEGYFPNGLYWCIRNQNKVSKKLERLMQRENAFWVEIDGFDDFMAELHQGLGLTLPDAVRDPYKATTERLNRFILPSEKVKHEVIKNDIAKLEEQVKRFELVISGKAPREEFDRLAPYSFLGDLEYKRNDYKNALLYYEKALLQNPDDLDMMGRLVWSYIYREQFAKAFDISERMIKQAAIDFRGYWRQGTCLVYLNRVQDAIARFDDALKYAGKEEKAQTQILISKSNALLINGNWEQALSDAENALKITPESNAALINKSIALKKLGRKGEIINIIQDAFPKIEYKYNRAGLFAVLDDKNNMLRELKAAIKEDRGKRVSAKFDPDFADYREDPDFKKLLYEEKL